MVTLTSFAKSGQFRGKKYSVSRWQPKGFQYPVLDFLSAVDAAGKPLKLQKFSDPLTDYKKAFIDGIKARWDRVYPWLKGLRPSEDVVLCCWCPYSATSQKQIKEFGTFACHTGLIGQLIQKFRPDIKVVLDNDREKHLIQEWRPVENRCRLCDINGDGCYGEKYCAGPYVLREDGALLSADIMLQLDVGAGDILIANA